LTFPAAYLGFPSTQTLTVTNNGTTGIAFNGVSVTGPAATDFSLALPFPLPPNYCASPGLAAGATCVMPVKFTPSAIGPRTATLLIPSGAINSLVAIPLSGTGLAHSGGPVTLSPSSLTFTLAGVPQPVTVTNLGTTPVAIGPIAFSADPIPYPVLLEQTNNCGGTLAAQSICTISVQADSLSTVTNSATMTVTDSAVSGAQTLPINIPGSVHFSASPINFGSWALGVTGSPQYASATSGSSSFPPFFTGSITGPNASDFAFPSGNGCGGGLGPSSCQLFITFTPSGLGVRTATLVIDNYGNIPLSGTGIPDEPSFTITTPSIIAGELIGISSPPSSIVVVNNGTTPVSLSGITVTGANAGDFAVTNPCNYNFPPVTTCSLSVVFTPSRAGLETATLTLTDAISGLSETATLQAVGEQTITPPTLTFSNTEVGAVSAAQTATISGSNGGDPVEIVAIIVPPSSPGDFPLSPGTCATQTPCQVSVTFRPSATGQRNATYQVTDIVTGVFSELSLSGTGGVATVSLSISSLTFAARNEGTTSIPQTVTLTNNGDANLTVSGAIFIGANAGDFSLQGNTCGSVVPGGNCTISVSFNPTAPGARSAIMQIMSNATTSPDSVQLSGTGN
jgi:hypothetical protein